MSLGKRLNKMAVDLAIKDEAMFAAENRTKQAILADLLEIIGEDEIDNFPDIHEIAPRLRNQLRQELREKIKAYCD